MRITSWIVKKKVNLCWKNCPQQSWTPGDFFIHLVRSLINVWFSTSQIEETNKQTKLGRREVDQSDGHAISMENCLELSTTTLVCLYQQQQQQEQLLQQQQQQQINQQLQQYFINENQNCDDEDLDETNSKSHLSFPLLLHTLFSAINQCK